MIDPYGKDEDYPPMELLEFLAEAELYANGYSDDVELTAAAIMAAEAIERAER
jgi:hypothetical protein